MKKQFFYAPVLLLLLAMFGCKKEDIIKSVTGIQTLNFTMNVAQDSRIPPPSIFYTGLPKPVTIITNSAQAFQTNKTTRDKVKSVLLDQMQLTLVSPSNLNFDFLDTLRVYINTPNVNNRILLANLYNPPRGVKSLTLIPTTARLEEYLKADTYELTVYSRQRPNYFIRDSLTVRSDATFKVVADPL
ncbi:hypothetical protein GCM10027594_22150 [Hymenobacter agri]